MTTTKLSARLSGKLATQPSARLSGKLFVRLHKNHSGSVSWRVCGMMHGERIRRNFKDKADALAEKRSLEIKIMQDTSGLRLVGTFLTDPQLREAEAVFLKLQSLRERQEQLCQRERQWGQNHPQPWVQNQPQAGSPLSGQQPPQSQQSPQGQQGLPSLLGQQGQPERMDQAGWQNLPGQQGQSWQAEQQGKSWQAGQAGQQGLPGQHGLPGQAAATPSPLHSLTFCVDYALAHYVPPVGHKPLAEALAAYCQQRRGEHAKERLSEIHLNGILRHMRRVEDFFPGLSVGGLTGERIVTFCETDFAGKGLVAFKTHNSRRSLISNFLQFAEGQKWLPTGEAERRIAEVPYFEIDHKRGSAPSLTAGQAAKLMKFLETYEGGKLVPHYALLLFAGIRPDINNGEIFKLPASDIRLGSGKGGGKGSGKGGGKGSGKGDDFGVIHVEPWVSKVGMKRLVAIQPNLHAWLTAYPLEKYPIMVPSLSQHRAEIAKQFGLTPDILRHTFISMHVAKFRSMGDTALQAGNTERIIRRHYLDVKSPEEAVEFFNIKPKVGGKRKAAATVAVAESVEAGAEPAKAMAKLVAKPKKARAAKSAEGPKAAQAITAEVEAMEVAAGSAGVAAEPVEAVTESVEVATESMEPLPQAA